MQPGSQWKEGGDEIPARPLLRQPAPHDAGLIGAAGFGGVILDASGFDAEFAHQCRAQSLSVWLDLSALSAPGDDLKKQYLVFEGLKPHLEMSGDELDTLHPGSAHIAIEQMESWAETLSGVLFDAAPHPPSVPFPPFPWSPQLSASFQARHGFDIYHRIETLVSSGGDEAARVRQQYWDEVQHVHRENFLQPLQNWCAQRGIAFAARCFRVEWNSLSLPPHLRVRLEAAATALEDAPAYPATLRDGENSTREFHDLLRAGAGAFARSSDSRLDTPPQILWNQTVEQSAGALTGGRNAARIGLLFPARSAQTHYHPDGHRFTRWVGDDLKHVTGLLEDLHFDWLFISENQLASAVQSGGKLEAGATAHPLEMVVVPSVTALSWPAWEKLEQFVEGGGKVACLGLLPRWSERGRDRALEERIGKATRIIAEDLYQAYTALEGETEMPPTIGYPIFREYHSGGRLCCYQPRLNADAQDARLRVRQILHESLAPDFETLAPHVRYTHRIAEKSEVFGVVNDGPHTQRVNARLRPRQTGAPVEIEVPSGEEKPIFIVMPYSPEEGGGIGLSFELAPAQARFIEIQNSNLQTQNSLERATFDVEYYDGQTATGYMTQNGAPQVALRKGGIVEWHAGASVALPTPLLADADEWNETQLDGAVEYSQSLTVPVEWKECRVFLEVATSIFALQCSVNGGDGELKLAPPFRFDVTLFLAFGASNDFTLKVFHSGQDEAPLTRLVAYPRVAVKITP